MSGIFNSAVNRWLVTVFAKKLSIGTPAAEKPNKPFINTYFYEYNDYNKTHMKTWLPVLTEKRFCCVGTFLLRKFVYLIRNLFDKNANIYTNLNELHYEQTL